MKINNAIIDSGFFVFDFFVYIYNKKLFPSLACLQHIHLIAIEKNRLKTKTLDLLKLESYGPLIVSLHGHICQLHQHRPSPHKCSRNSNVDKRVNMKYAN